MMQCENEYGSYGDDKKYLNMFIGGTNFGFTSGANHGEKFTPDVTSYDYDALLSECGDVTEKYHAVRNVVKKYVKEELPDIPPNRPKKAFGTVKLTEKAVFLIILKDFQHR